MKTTAKAETLQKALDVVNAKYDGNIEFERFEPNCRSVNFTLRVKSSRKPGARRSQSGRRMAKACWHVHGDLFDAVLVIDPKARIVSRGGPGAVITDQGGNWQDCNIGSMMQPMMFSQACDCGQT
jgi:hypothetical protein